MDLDRMVKVGWPWQFIKISASFTAVAMITCSLQAQEEAAKKEPLKSGPAVGESARPYHPLLANGDTVGQRWCMVCTYRGRCSSMVLAFIRKNDERAAKLMTAVESATKKHKKSVGIITFLTTEGKTAKEVEALTGAKVAYLNEGEKKQFEELGKFSKKGGIKSSLNIYSTDGPAGYKLSPDAALTLLVANTDAVVTANIALKDSEFTEKSVQSIVEKVEEALSKKE